jgi:glycine/D-amino acid oxidase-like deaminating enzyme
MEAISEFALLKRELGPLPIAARGALVWQDNEEETSKLIEEQQVAGVHIEALDRARVMELEPHLAVPPTLAAWAPDDFALEPIDLTCQLLNAAREAGAEVACGTTVESVEMVNGRIVGVRTTRGVVPAQIVVLANAASAITLAAKFGIRLPVREEPAVLMRFSAEAGAARHLLYGQGLELRPDRAGGLVSAEDYPNEGEAGLAELAKRTAATITRMFALTSRPSLLSVGAAYRPMTDGGSPLRTFLPEVEGLYAVIAHPGVILAPRLGRLAAEEIVRSAR